MKHDYDVIIVGGGMVGTTFALLLAQQTQLQIALIEAHQPEKLALEDAPLQRVSAINPASQQILSAVNIWQSLFPSRLGPFDKMQVWETADSNLYFNAAEIGTAYLGHIVENRHIQQQAIAEIRKHPQITFICPAQPEQYQAGQIRLENGKKLTAGLIVAADGARSMLREQTGIQSRGWAYQQHGLVATIRTEKSHQKTAWQRFLPGGPLAFLPLHDGHLCSIVWSLPTEAAKQMKALDKSDFELQLAEAFEYRLGNVELVSERASFPLALAHAKEYVKPGFALLGDAAHTIHPLAGQGVNIGLQDAKALADVIVWAEANQRQIGSLHTLKKYQRRRLAENLLMQFSMDGFHRLFTQSASPISWLRTTGMQQVNKSQWLKNCFMLQAIGTK
ncbi:MULTISPECIES: UbiH/UbiF/VisC/COQ6 family ubiquinone biosynthesis hydroxylase [unclassified Methylophaga]|uniref:UbiH/UbiF/VisC/COQ6 family ubiquinone biosynthesis hydroxylase n=1 Tax=unclassified Methylophaga TaxID=2629249 RepID=UPI000C8A99C1|nr:MULTISPECIES: UbiH/UbiF/VisC/COQ6 family ubiquinone biosynthesis hydroxylase [unclassified Methylophaga]MBN46036.1 FAD-binding protein [Methylophaga sp.]|tara:strand:- start:74766 stop:75938 length:1173 start_codon:yes stop_codon:yes gene_type:complete